MNFYYTPTMLYPIGLLQSETQPKRNTCKHLHAASMADCQTEQCIATH
jgi:hypothetical protein